jgi:hypothetical protein
MDASTQKIQCGFSNATLDPGQVCMRDFGRNTARAFLVNLDSFGPKQKERKKEGKKKASRPLRLIWQLSCSAQPHLSLLIPPQLPASVSLLHPSIGHH